MGLAAAMWVGLVLSSAHAAPVEETRGQVGVLHGGIGEEDRAAMAQKAADHNLRLTFARKGSGAYLSDVKVMIRDVKGSVVIDTVASGPWLFARLPTGQYSVTATAQDVTLTQSISLQGNSRRDWVFRFDPPAGEAPELNPK
jgi:hypothetical protein